MVKVIIASHHKLADGMGDTLEYLVPSLTDIETISAYLDNEPIDSAVEAALGRCQDTEDVVVFTDLLGGSVNQEFVRQLKPNVHVIAGMNLPIIMTLLLQLENQPLSEELITQSIEEAKNQIIYVNQFLKESVDDLDEDEL
ncbi:PTS sugar transporter subunit IIA [uncultured Streptococcus sp.]|uniref:PTS sugar transporter subunit IIA n=1 Tax=uncultured Streptococcus sp. TaxID=83427 RepID=UPI0026117477|nr:PTS N-acetylglucosamine transporter subunit IIBC [uncultured Streptococcus sp.]